MSPTILPIIKTLYLCDDVAPDPVSRKLHLLGVFSAVRPTVYPFWLRQICVVAQLVGGIGESTARIEVTDASTSDQVYTSPEYRLQFQDRHTILPICIRIRNCPFPISGVYLVELYCQGVFIDDRVLHLLEEEATEP